MCTVKGFLDKGVELMQLRRAWHHGNVWTWGIWSFYRGRERSPCRLWLCQRHYILILFLITRKWCCFKVSSQSAQVKKKAPLPRAWMIEMLHMLKYAITHAGKSSHMRVWSMGARSRWTSGCQTCVWSWHSGRGKKSINISTTLKAVQTVLQGHYRAAETLAGWFE